MDVSAAFLSRASRVKLVIQILQSNAAITRALAMGTGNRVSDCYRDCR